MLPPCPLRKRILRKPWCHRLLATSRTTLVKVAADKVTVPGKSMWWGEYPVQMGGVARAGVPASVAFWQAASATVCAMRQSTSTGKWPPCCSVAPTGTTMTVPAATASLICGQLRSVNRTLNARPSSLFQAVCRGERPPPGPHARRRTPRLLVHHRRNGLGDDALEEGRQQHHRQRRQHRGRRHLADLNVKGGPVQAQLDRQDLDVPRKQQRRQELGPREDKHHQHDGKDARPHQRDDDVGKQLPGRAPV